MIYPILAYSITFLLMHLLDAVASIVLPLLIGLREVQVGGSVILHSIEQC